MKTTQLCKSCQCELPFASFSPSAVGKNGTSCRSCNAAKSRQRYQNDPAYRRKEAERARQWAEKNPERTNARKRAHYEANKEAMTRRSVEWGRANRPKRLAAIAQWHKNNPVRSYAHTRTRQLRIKGQTPPDADFETIAAFYEESARLTRETGVRHHVDHIIPLSRGGLHHQDNLRVVTMQENLSKGAKLLEQAA